MGIVYSERMDKLAMVLATAVELKTSGVAEWGVGEDLNQSLYGWRGDELAVLARMTNAMQAKDSEARFVAVSSAAMILRHGWGIDAITMVAEGFVSDDPEGTKGKSFAKEFARGNSAVKEAITISHIEGEEISFVTKAYSYEVPKRVVWEEEVFMPGKQKIVGSDGMYPIVLSKALTFEPAEIDEEAEDFYQLMCINMIKKGFETRSFR